ncbi:DNA-3-methyladenine glycosylase I [Actinomyces sp. oral taxon 181]|uniref:DNA-3-methyladenine glycosylase I n=1 Tax=Actinomyces sp. oral taxon 181 TaxID=712121 RepID=UPI0025BF3137|nr:DNA-3-methyladenine glycosylase I [Actinomyces sp. oral taxon 181]MBS5751164.1 DNA-3-methyladenine glycosylase I [Actinomyces sp. oral taxon 181]
MALPEGLVACEDGRVRPCWAATDPLLRGYYDTEWGKPVTSEQGVFERLVLESFQSGLSWSTILKKRQAFRDAFASFIPEAVASFTDKDRERLMRDAGIVRNGRKINAAITNARAVIALRGALAAEADAHRAGRMEDAPLAGLLRPGQSYPRHLGELVWLYQPSQQPRPENAGEVPAQTEESRALSLGLKRRGFVFVGPVTALALMGAIGIVNTDILGTWKRPSNE